MAMYYSLKHSQRGQYIRDLGISPNTIYKWRDQMIAGDIDTGLRPRQTVVMSTDEANDIKRLLKENAELKKQNEALRRRAHANQEAAEALGKAIATLQSLSED
ncbi:hypothetical protein [Corynebacterium sp. H130]|uniref:hypothetical protein n=1 Tax=Corynebacterium sp. H130 TaxID=3133444 RepID=UPI0030A1FB45